jgi:hypothetical protein
LVPRAGVTYVDGPFHSKLLYSQTYRKPMLGNNSYSVYGMNAADPLRPTKITPEKGDVAEFETGYRFSSRLSTTFNLFYQKISNTITFNNSSTTGNFYFFNGSELGTWGGEIEAKYNSASYKSLLNFSYNKLAESSYTWYLTYPTADNLVGQPDYKIYTNHSYSFRENWSAQISAMFLARQKAARCGATVASCGIIDLDPQLLLGAGILWDGITNMNVGLSIHDALNTRQKIVDAGFYSSNAPINYKGREISLDLAYRF